MVLILLHLAGIALAGYVLARRLDLGPAARWLLALQLGLVGGPALTWITGVLVHGVRPDLPVWVLAALGAVLAVLDLHRHGIESTRTSARAAGPYLLVALLLCGAQCTLVATSGWRDGDLRLAVFHQKDGILHLAISAMLRPGEDFSHTWPPEDPLMAGRRLVNYHPLSDVLVALLAPHEDHVLVYFRVLPPLYSLMFCLASAWTVREWGGARRVQLLAMGLAVLCSSFGHLIYPWIPGRDPFLESRFWMSQPFSMLYNPPFALSLGSLFCLLAVFSRPRVAAWPAALVAGVLLGLGFSVKAFLTVVLGPALLLAAIRATSEERALLARATILSGAGALVMMKLTTDGAGSFLQWDPGWPLRTMPARLGLPPVESWPAGAILGPILLLLFYFGGNLGLRILALPDLFRATRAPMSGLRIAAHATVISITLPLLVSMGGVYYNAIQFAYYGLAILPLWLAFRVDPWVFEGSMRRRACVVVALLALGLPGSIATMWSNDFGTRIERAEVEELRKIGRSLPLERSIVVYPEPIPGRVSPGRRTGFVPPRSGIETAYVPAIAARACWLTDPFNVGVRMISCQDRLAEIRSAFPGPGSPPPRAWMEARGIGAAYTPR